MHTRRNAIAWFWGFAEATVFIIVPDVLISWLAVHSYKRAFAASLWVLCGALIGGGLLWFVGQTDPEPARALFVSLPAINDAMIADVRSQLDDMGLMAVIVGPLSGTPYKLYAVEAATLGFGLTSFLLVSIPARLLRFLLVSVVAGALGQFAQRKWGLHVARVLLAAFWVALYAWYFSVMAD
ncbi:MAG: hypothetical protein OEM85_12655 [Gammaproteobacteria bacterium]|nr:hypothetical protein [Gammaproteobacteria bacterium]MDH3408745.1 hypothetical protein [Gammaproteobacteria bacterium]